MSNKKKKNNTTKFLFITDDNKENLEETEKIVEEKNKETQTNLQEEKNKDTNIDSSKENKEKEISEKITLDNDKRDNNTEDGPSITISNELSKKGLKNVYPIPKKLYISFEARVISMILIILLLFSSACYLILEAVNIGKDEIISYNENSTANYKVCLNQNDYYNDSCLSEDMEYVSSLINNIAISFNYNSDLSSTVDNKLAYHIVAVTRIYDKDDVNKTLYQNEELLLEKTDIKDYNEGINFSADIDLDFKKYNNYVIDYKNNYILNVSASLQVILYLDEKDKIEKAATIEIPLSNQTFGIKKYVISNKNKTIKKSNNSWNKYNGLCSFIACILIIVSLILLFKTTKLVLKVCTNKNKYEIRLKQILRDYDRVIVIAKDGYEINTKKKVIKVDSFDELLDARDTLEKPIIYSKINDVKSEFIVEDNDKIFKYVLKEADL